MHIDIDRRINYFSEYFDKLPKTPIDGDVDYFLLVNTSLWARNILEYIDEKYEPVKEIKISAGSAGDETCYLKGILSKLIHSTYTNMDNDLLNITSDRKIMITVRYKEFITALEILNIDPCDRVLIVCEKLREIFNRLRGDLKNNSINLQQDFDWLLANATKNNLELKRSIMKDFFEKQESDLILPQFSFHPIIATSKLIRIVCKFEKTSFLSDVFPYQKIFNLIKDKTEKQKAIATLLHRLELITPPPSTLIEEKEK